MSDKELRDVERFARQKGKEAAQPLPPKNRTMIERYTSDDVLDFNPTGEFVYYSDHEAALAAERAKVRELVECLSNVRALQEAIMNDRQSDLEFQHEQRCLARHAESLLRINTKALIEKCSKEEPNNE